MTAEQCPHTSTPVVAFNERHPDKQLSSWRYIARKLLTPATCMHRAEAVNLLVIGVSDAANNSGTSFAVDFDNGYLNKNVDVLSFGREDPLKPEGALLEPDAMLSAEALQELREAIEKYRVLEWPFREPGEPVVDGEYTVRDGFELAVVFYDDTGSHAEQPEKSDADMVGFLKFAQEFLAEHLE